ncbi:hypothetical protein CRYUN_Cryun35bG0078000 [Craigia yunnanensis]
MKNLSVFERALIGAGGGGIVGAFTYVCLYPLDTIKTKLQTKGASVIYVNTFDAIVKTFQTKGILGFYRGVSAVIVGSMASSAVYFGTCEFGWEVRFVQIGVFIFAYSSYCWCYRNIVSSAIMVPKELITQIMQAGAKGRSWEVLLRILEKDGILGLYAASLTTPLDVVKTRLMTQVHGNKVAAAMYSGIYATVKQILKEEGWIGLTRGMGPRVVHSVFLLWGILHLRLLGLQFCITI